MTLIVRNPYVSASLAGGQLSKVISARCSFGFDLRVSEAYITVPTKPSSGTYWDTVTLTIGATQQTAALRFSGILQEYDFDLFPGACTLVCRGNLYRALVYENATINGTDLTNGGQGQTDIQMVQQVLGTVPGLNVNSGAIGGTGKLLGTSKVWADHGPQGQLTGPFAWGGPSALGQGVGETALSFIERLDVISEGYRTFETLGGNIIRFQIYGRPTAASDVPQFNEGVDIFSGRGVRTILPFKNAAMVTGYDFGTGYGPVFYLNTSGTYASQGQFTISLSSPMLEKYQENDTQSYTINGFTYPGTGLGPGTGQSCAAVAGYLLAEYDREIVKLVMTTPRDDLIGPGQTHSIYSPRLGITEPLWVQRVDIELTPQGEFSQTMTYLGGGLSPGSTPPVQ